MVFWLICKQINNYYINKIPLQNGVTLIVKFHIWSFTVLSLHNGVGNEVVLEQMQFHFVKLEMLLGQSKKITYDI